MGRSRVVRAVLVSLWLVAAVVAAVPVVAQDRVEEAIEAPLVDVTHARRAHGLVETWLADQPDTSTKADPIRVTGLIGVRLTLRSRGIMVGQGEAYREDLDAVVDRHGPAIDLVPLLNQATNQAKAGVRESLADVKLRAVLEGRSLPEAKELTVADVHVRIIVDLELAFGPETIKVPAGAKPDAVFARFAPCYHGLGFSNPSTGLWSWVWPGEAIARNISPSSQLVLGLKRLGIDRSLVQQLARPDGISLVRFRSIHLVRPAGEDEPAVIVRSGTDRPRYAVGDRELEGLSDQLTEHLYNRFTTDGQLRGTYHPTSGRYDPSIADDDQAALACYAMMHHSRYLAEARPFDDTPTLYIQRSLTASGLLADRILRADAEAEPRTVALLLLTLLEAPAGEGDQVLRDLLAERLIKQVGVEAASGGTGSKLTDGSAALAAAALATLYERTRQPEAGEMVKALMDRLWTRRNGTPNLSALPWLALAHERAGGLLAEMEASSDDHAEQDRRDEVMAGVIDRLCRSQVIERPTLGPSDVLGGFVLTPGPAGSPPNPDWHNAQPLMLLSIVLRDQDVTSERDKLGWLISAGYSARFIGLLMMDNASCYYVRDRVAARGGVRMAPWDNRLALAPSAMSLLALTELQTTLAQFRPKPSHADDSEPQLEGVQAAEDTPGEGP